MKLVNPVQVSRFTIKLKGSEKFELENGGYENGTIVKKKSHTYFDFKRELPFHGGTFNPGCYELDIKFQLPRDIHSSFLSTHDWVSDDDYMIRYFCKIKIKDHLGTSFFKYKKPFIVREVLLPIQYDKVRNI